MHTYYTIPSIKKAIQNLKYFQLWFLAYLSVCTASVSVPQNVSISTPSTPEDDPLHALCLLDSLDEAEIEVEILKITSWKNTKSGTYIFGLIVFL